MFFDYIKQSKEKTLLGPYFYFTDSKKEKKSGVKGHALASNGRECCKFNSFPHPLIYILEI